MSHASTTDPPPASIPGTSRRRRPGMARQIRVAALWLCGIYLVLHYGALLTFGPMVLFEHLGQDAYNSWVAPGGVLFVILLLPSLLLVQVLWRLAHGGQQAIARRLVRRGGRACAALGGWVGVAAVVLGVLLCWRELSLGTPLEVLLSCALTMDTEYPPGWSEASFQQIELGVERTRVEELLGAPLLTRHRESRVYAHYSRSPSDGHYWRRMLVYDEQALVEQVVRELYVD